MARIRTCKPEFWTSEQVVSLSHSERLLFIGLWNFADDRGVHKASPRRLLMEVFPGDDLSGGDVQRWIDRLIEVGLVGYFEHEGEGYWYVTGWHHQKIDRPSFSRLPPPPNKQSSTSPRRVLDEPSSREGKGKEGSLKEGSRNRKGEDVSCSEGSGAEEEPFTLSGDSPASDRVLLTFPTRGKAKSWALRESLLAELRECFEGIDVTAECRRALGWIKTHPERKKTPKGMPGFLYDWIGRTANRGGARASPSEAGQGLDLSILDDD